MASGEVPVQNSVYATTIIAALEVRIKDARRLRDDPDAAEAVDKRIKAPELLKHVMQNGELRTNRSKDTPLILATRTGDLNLVKYFAEHSTNASPGCEVCEYAEMSVPELLCHRNVRKESALLVAMSMCLESGIHNAELRTAHRERSAAYQPECVCAYLLKLAVRECQSSAVFYHATEARQNLLHLAFSRLCSHCEDFCVARHLLRALSAGSVCIDPRQEDYKKFTPLFYLLKRGNKGADESGDALDANVVRRQKQLIRELKDYSTQFGIPWEEMLVNSCGMDIAHVCASCNSIQFLMRDLISEMSPGRGLHLMLYRYEPTEFDSQIVLGGPIESLADERGAKSRWQQLPTTALQLRHSRWTALHFACDGGHSESMAHLMLWGFRLQDSTRDGSTCTDLVFSKPDRQEALLCAFHIASRATEGRVGPLGRSWILEYATCVDSVRSALDIGDSDGERMLGTITEAAADAELGEAWRLFKKSQKYRGLSFLEEMNVKALMYMCFENDSATQYRALLHSSYWSNAIGNPRKFGFQMTGPTIVEEQLPDRDFIKFFLRVKEEIPEMEAEVPVKERLGLKVDFMWLTFEGLSLDRRQSNAVSRRPLFTYRDNGKVFLRKLDKPPNYYQLLSLADLAIITGRATMAKALLITRQFDLIPSAFAAIIRCNRLIREEHLIHYYPIRDSNLELRSVKAFAARIAINAIDLLFRGCRDREADLVFEYLLGKMSAHDGAGTEAVLPHSKLLVRKLEIKNDREITQAMSTLELIRKSENADFYGTECIQQLVEKLWHEPPEYNSSNLDHVYEAAESRAAAAALGQNRKSNSAQNLKRYLQCPRRKIILYGTSTIVFIGFLITSLTNSSVYWNWTDVVLLCFLASFIVQEAHECLIRTTTIGEGFSSYLLDIWSVYDLLNIIFLLAAFVYKAAIHKGAWGDLNDADASKIGRDEAVYYQLYHKILLSVSLLLVSARFLKTLRFSRSLGVNIVVLPYIFYRDLMPFVIILALMIVSFGSVFLSLLTVGRYSFDGSNVVRRNDNVLFEMYSRPLLSAFGEFQLDSLDACDSKALGTGDLVDGCYFPYAKLIYKRFVLLVFIMIVNLVMFNMLIAKFSNTISRFETRWQLIWLALRHDLLIDNSRLSPWPPPFNVPGTLWSLLHHCYKAFYRQSKRTAPELERKRWSLIGRNHEKFLLRMADRFRRMRHRMQTRDVENIPDDIEEELLGENINWKGARIQFDRAKQPASRGISASATDAVSKKLEELLRRSLRISVEDEDAAEPPAAS